MRVNGDRARFLFIFAGFSIVYLKMQSSKEYLNYGGSLLGCIIIWQLGQGLLLGFRLLCFSFQPPLFFLLLFLGEISLPFGKRIVGLGHLQSYSVELMVDTRY